MEEACMRSSVRVYEGICQFAKWLVQEIEGRPGSVGAQP